MRTNQNSVWSFLMQNIQISCTKVNKIVSTFRETGHVKHVPNAGHPKKTLKLLLLSVENNLHCTSQKNVAENGISFNPLFYVL